MNTASCKDTVGAGETAAASQQSPGVTQGLSTNQCVICESAIGHKANVCNCVGCAGLAHTACLVSKYKESNVATCALKNSLEWLQGFLQHAGFHYTCQHCASSSNTGFSSVAARAGISSGIAATVGKKIDNDGVSQLQNDVANLQISIKAISSSLELITHELCDLKNLQPFSVPDVSAPPLQDGASSSESSRPATVRPMSYASVVSSTLTDTVKKAVADSIKDRDSVLRDSSSIMIYGLTESRYDLQNVTNIFNAISVSGCEPVSCYRLGKRADDASSDRCRPLKVILSKPSDRSLVLLSAKKLKGHKSFSKVRISKYLSGEELDRLKQTRTQCKQLNDSSSSVEKKFVVINGKIMTKAADGKLKPYTQASKVVAEGIHPAAEKVNEASKPKNVK